VKSVNPFIQGQALFRYRSKISPVMVRGIGRKDNIPIDVKKFITEGADDYVVKKGVFIGHEMALMNNIKIGNIIELIVPKGRLIATTGVIPGIGKFRVLGFFKTGYYDFDTKLIIMSLYDAQKLYEVGDIAWGIGVKIDDVWLMDLFSSKIQAVVSYNYITTTAKDRNKNLFYALQLEKLIITIMLFLIMISAAFTIMGTLVMVVMEKRKSIGILKAMGAKPNSIMIIFILEGFLIGLFGSIIGVVFGLAASLNLEAIVLWIEKAINIVMENIYEIFNLGFFNKISIVPTHVYYIDALPTEVKPEFVVFIAIFAVFISTIASVFPAWNASKLKPVETIRYE